MTDYPRLTIPFGVSTSQAIAVPADADPGAVLAALRLPPFHALVVMHGGAGNMDPALTQAVQRFFTASLAPFAERHRVLIVDGGTHAGSMAAMGAARQAVGGSYPLVGVAPASAVSYPGGPTLDDEHAPLDPGHSHFVLVSGGGFGVESALLVGLLRAADVPGAALIVNGGEIVQREAEAQLAGGNPVIAVQGSGRAADELASENARQGGLTVIALDDPAALDAALARLLLRAPQ